MVSSVVRPASDAVTVHSPSRGSVVVKLPPVAVPVMVLWPSVRVRALPAVVVTVSFGSVLPSTTSSACCKLDAPVPIVSVKDISFAAPYWSSISRTNFFAAASSMIWPLSSSFLMAADRAAEITST